MSTNNYMDNSTSDNSDSDKEQLSPPQPNPQPTTTTPSTQPPSTPQFPNPPPYQSTPQTSQPIQEDKSSRAGIIGATTGGLTAHLLGGGILSTIGGAMAGAAGKKISEHAQALFPDLDQ